MVPQGKKKLERYLATLMDKHDDCGLSLNPRFKPLWNWY
jgi:hypothetical protein